MSQPLISVVVPCYNYGRYLAECVQSICAQTVSDLEIIIVDDASTDDTPQVAAGVPDPRVRIVRHPVNRGLVGALTTGLSEARGRFIARIDADDRYRRGFFEEALGLFSAHPEIGMVYGDVAAMDAAGTIVEDPWRGIRSRDAHDGKDACGDEFLANLEDNVIPTAAMIARRDAYLKPLPFPDWFTSREPSDWYLNVGIARDWPVYYRARTFGDYRLHPDNMHIRAMAVPAYEQTVLGVLNDAFSGTDRLEAKRQVRRRIYGQAFMSFANQYFAQQQYADARRCYLQSMRYVPAYGIQGVHLRHLATTFLPPTAYARIKRALGRP
jgi:glycosyltransferase involved in cell wall biosynthesis